MANKFDPKKFKKCIRDAFSSESGKYVLEVLESLYVETSVMNESDSITMYRLGQKELLQGLIRDARSDESSDEEETKPTVIADED